MNGFQQKVNLYQAMGIPGAPAGINPMPTDPVGKVAAEDIKIGTFCFIGSENQVISSGDAPYGFVVREVSYPIIDAPAGAQDFVPEGLPVTVALRGDFYAVTSTKAAAGEKIFASLTDGSLAAGAAGASMPGFAETNYEALMSGEAGDVIVISNWRN